MKTQHSPNLVIYPAICHFSTPDRDFLLPFFSFFLFFLFYKAFILHKCDYITAIPEGMRRFDAFRAADRVHPRGVGPHT